MSALDYLNHPGSPDFDLTKDLHWKPIADKPAVSLTGGKISEEDEQAWHSMRRKLKASDEVYDVLELSRRCDGKWLYLIQCPLSWVFPKYVIGLTDADVTAAEQVFQSGAEWSAKMEWHKLRHGGSEQEAAR